MSTHNPSEALRNRKLAALRARTDHDLEALLRQSLEQGVHQAGAAEYVEAENLYSQTAALLPLVKGLSLQQTVALQIRLHDLRARLDHAALTEAALAS